jgi:hypothetical protein
MSRWQRVLLSIVVAPIFLLGFTVIHETGHTLLARLLGDPASTFYLVRIDPDGTGMCLGCNITDHTRLSRAGNLAVSVGGLLATQAVAIAALGLLRLARGRAFRYGLLSAVAVGFAFLDVPVQVIQSLVYDWSRQTWPTNVDLVDTMLLITSPDGPSQLLLKALLALLAAGYLAAVWRAYRSERAQSAAS